MTLATAAYTDQAQAEALARLVEVEALWENMPPAGTRNKEAPGSVRNLRDKQKAFDSYRAHLVAYNRRYDPAYEAEWAANTPARLAAWCRRMRDLFQRIPDTEPCPVHLMDKVYRRADRIGVRLAKEPVGRTTPLEHVRDAIHDLGAVAEWCDALSVANAAPDKSK